MEATVAKKPVERPKFENPRMSAVCMEFDWKLDHGDARGALGEVLRCKGLEAGQLVSYAIKRLEQAGARTEAERLKSWKNEKKG